MNKPKTYLFSLILQSIVWCTAVSQPLKPLDDGSLVKFKIKNFGSTTSGTMKGLEGTIEFDPAQPANARFDVSVDANTVDTNVGLRDKHLRKEEYFDVSAYPRVRFVSTSVTSSTPGKYVITGNLTIKATTKSISFPFTYTSSGATAVFEGEFPLNRRDFSVGGGSFSLSDNLTVFLTIRAER